MLSIIFELRLDLTAGGPQYAAFSVHCSSSLHSRVTQKTVRIDTNSGISLTDLQLLRGVL